MFPVVTVSFQEENAKAEVTNDISLFFINHHLSVIYSRHETFVQIQHSGLRHVCYNCKHMLSQNLIGTKNGIGIALMYEYVIQDTTNRLLAAFQVT